MCNTGVFSVLLYQITVATLVINCCTIACRRVTDAKLSLEDLHFISLRAEYSNNKFVAFFHLQYASRKQCQYLFVG